MKKLRENEQLIKDTELDFSDAPEEFLDGITTELMTDPVELPVSKIKVDRKTIETHLLSDQTDPFNRTKLTRDMLIPCEELKEKIDAYINKKKIEKQSQIKNKL